ncbi:MAG: hypothetical protein ACK4FP_13075 [Azonexus sp.]
MLRKSLIPLILVTGLLAGPVHAEKGHERHLAPETTDYALILPANLPHVLKVAQAQAGRLKLDEAQKTLIRDLMADAPLKVFARLKQAESLEKAIAQDVLSGAVSETELASRLDSLVSAKRQATEAQIATIGRIRASLSEAQFKQLLKLATTAGSH